MLLFARLLPALVLLSLPLRAEEFLAGVRRIVFLGDSITHAGHYVDDFEAYLLTRFPDRTFEVINLGLPSETVSGLSEEGHAGGKFPRPDLHERLDRVLAQIKPDLVFACYGINDGIYQPFSEERFAKFQDGIRRLREKVSAAKAQIFHLTPFVFDPVPIKARTAPAGAQTHDKPFEGYDEVLERYTAWLVAQRAQGWRVIDLHTTLKQILVARRAADPSFRFADDGVHPHAAAHWIATMEIVGDLAGAERPQAMQLLNELRTPDVEPVLLKLVRERGRLLSAAWLTQTGHTRPGMARGLPVEQAQARAAELEKPIRDAANRARLKSSSGPRAKLVPGDTR